jgi:prenyltransferase beta subunit
MSTRSRRDVLRLALAAMPALALPSAWCTGTRAAEELYPKHCSAKTKKAVDAGLAYLARTQANDGNWAGTPDAGAYPVSMAALAGMAFLANGNTPSRGPYADNVRRVEHYLMDQAKPSGIITGAGQEQGRPMYGHGFGLMFLASVYGMETDDRARAKLRKVIEAAIELTARGQSNIGGWTYYPGGGDEGSVTVTQIQALRAAHNAGFTVPKGVIEESVRYLERCKTAEGGICYSFGSGGDTRIAITAAAVATLYNAGQYDSQLADSCLQYVWKHFRQNKGDWSVMGHGFYAHLYAAQAFYQAGERDWDEYFPAARDRLLAMQQGDGSWTGDGIGPVYGTAIALTILQLPYKFLPIYQR